MKIYTRTGDTGLTGLFGGERVQKEDARVDAYGTVDETNAAIGVARSMGLPSSIRSVLEEVQRDLLVMGAELACAPGKENKLGVALLAEVNIQRLETAIDHAESELTPLKNFILPAGSPGAAALHHARTVCRRAERCFWLATRQEPLRPELGRYLNRLSDLLFVLARSANRHSGVPDETWTPRQG